MDFFSRPFIYLFGIFLTLVVVFEIFVAKMDNNVQTYCDEAIEEFVDKSRSAGYISAESYLEMTRKINATGNLYNISITHQSKTSVPRTEYDGSEIIGEDGEAVADVTYSYNTYNKEDILSVLFPDGPGYGRYNLKNGDYLKVTLSLKEPTMAARLWSKFTGKELKTISGSYGGYVGSTSDSLTRAL